MTCPVSGCPAPKHLLAEQWPLLARELRLTDADELLIARAPMLAHALAGLVEAVKADDMGEQAQVDLRAALAAAEEALKP